MANCDETGARPGKPVVLITGAAGSIGSAISKALSEDYQVVGLDLACDGYAHPCREFDISDEDSVRATLDDLAGPFGRKFAAVIHLAAYFDFTGEDHPAYHKVNEQGARNLMRALQDYEVERLIYSGTMLVHRAGSPGERINERAPIEPKWAYPRSKAKTEAIIAEERGSIPVTFLHLAGLYDEESAVPTLTHQIARIYERDLKSHVYAGDQDAGQSFIHQDDLVDLFVRAVDRRAAMDAQETILAGERHAVSYAELQDSIGELVHGKEAWLTISAPKPLAKAGAAIEAKSEPVVPDAIDHGEKPFIRPFMMDMAEDHYALDISRAKDRLGWRPRHDIRETLPKIVAALKNDPAAWYDANAITKPDWMAEADARGDDPEALREDHEAKLKTEHARFRWAHLLVAALGVWMIGSPPILSYESTALIWSDVVCGAILTASGLASAYWRFERARWVSMAVAFWMLWAPLVLWTPTAEAYTNQTLVGALVLGLALCSRPEPGVSPAAAMTGPDTPPGWDFSPSTWAQRLPIIALAVIGLMISRHLTAYQLGNIEGIWDPVFSGTAADPKNGSEEITTSSVSEAFPIPDAGLGAVTYMLEIIIGIAGTRARWRTMPWMVMGFGIMIVPLGVVSITFIIIQPIFLDAYCLLCLIAAAAMLIQIPYSLEELIATCQFLIRRKKKGRPLLRVFFTGDTDDGPDAPYHVKDEFDRPLGATLKDIFLEGVQFPPTLVVSALIGVWFMITPLTLGVEGGLDDANHFIGALIITASVIAFSETGRATRWLNAAMAVLLIGFSLLWAQSWLVLGANIAVCLLLIALTPPRGPVKSTYGSWDKYVI
ncbi:MAG: NAD-dependent epimerase/dehydratase family protein [Oceanicaulis sp.]